MRVGLGFSTVSSEHHQTTEFLTLDSSSIKLYVFREWSRFAQPTSKSSPRPGKNRTIFEMDPRSFASPSHGPTVIWCGYVPPTMIGRAAKPVPICRACHVQPGSKGFGRLVVSRPGA